MTLLCARCPLCLAPAGYPHAEGCEVSPGPKAPAPTPEERAELLEAVRARALEAWLRGGPVPPNRGGKPREEKDLP